MAEWDRFSVNAMSAISTKGGTKGRMHFMVFTESFTAEVMCRFLDRSADHFDHKVHLVVDGHCAHRSRKVRDWLAARPGDDRTSAGAYFGGPTVRYILGGSPMSF